MNGPANAASGCGAGIAYARRCTCVHSTGTCPMAAKRLATKAAPKRAETQTARAVPTAKRARKSIVVDLRALERATAALGSTNPSETVNVALTRLAEDAAILAGIDAAIRSVPDFPDPDS